MDYNVLSQNQYDNELKELIKATEDTHTTLYGDSKGLLTIGWGFNIQDDGILRAVLKTGLGVNVDESDEDESTLLGGDLLEKIKDLIKSESLTSEQKIAQINGLWLTYTGDPEGEFSLTSQQMEDVFEAIKGTYERKVDDFYPVKKSDGTWSGIETSYERLALFSLAYNQVDGEAALLGPGLGASFDTDNRAQAWFEIAYLSNGDKLTGQAKRRMLEASLFGMYNATETGGSPTEKEILDILEFYSSDYAQQYIVAYEKEYGHPSTLAKADQRFQYFKDKIVGIEQVFVPIASQLIDQFVNDPELASLYKNSEFNNVIFGFKGLEKDDWITASGYNLATKSESEIKDLLINIKEEDATLSGGKGDDMLIGNSEKDTLYGGEADDLLLGQAGNDTLIGHSGEDTLYGGGDNDKLYAGSDKVADFHKTTDIDYLYGGKGDDHLYGDAGDDLLDGGEDKDVMKGGKGNDKYVVDHAEDSVVELEGEGEDTLVVKFDYELDAESHIENLELFNGVYKGVGSEHSNKIKGNNSANYLAGGDGADIIHGEGGNDVIYADNEEAALSPLIPSNDNHVNELYGGYGDDHLYGAEGNDLLDGGFNNDHLEGGLGDDTYIVDSVNDVVVEYENQGIDTVKSYTSISLTDDQYIENIELMGTAYKAEGNNHDNVIVGNDEDNVIYGWNGADKIYGGKGKDFLYATAPGWTSQEDGDELYGGDDNDVLVGDYKNNTLIGGDGDDHLIDFGGDDVLKGGIGFDTYHLHGHFGHVTIEDADGLGHLWRYDAVYRAGTNPVQSTTYKRYEGQTNYGGRWDRANWTGIEGGIYHDEANSILYIGDYLTIKNYQNGSLGINLVTIPEPVKPPASSPEPKEPEPPAPVEPEVPRRDPLALDLNGDGIVSVGYDAGVYFDLDNSGFAESTTWLSAEDAFVALDRNQDGIINNGGELFGSETLLSSGQYAANGFLALSDFDSNADGVMDAQDDIFGELLLWQDSNQNGQTDDGELVSLYEANIVSINLAYSESDYIDENDVAHRQQGSYTSIDQEGHEVTSSATSLWFDSNRRDSVPIDIQLEGDLPVPEDVQLLPDIKGIGNTYSLHQAIVRDETGQLKALVESIISESDANVQDALLTELLFFWTGQNEVDPKNPQYAIDARVVGAMETLLGEQISDDFGGVGSAFGSNINRNFEQYKSSVYYNLARQSFLKDVFDKVVYSYDAENNNWFGDYKEVTNYLFDVILDDPVKGKNDYKRFVKALSGLDPINLQYVESFKTTVLMELQSLSEESLVSILSVVRQFDDELVGSPLEDEIFAYDGNDTVRGSYSDDVIHGGQGNDEIYGDHGEDELYGDEGNDQLHGGIGDDTLNGGDGIDFLYGGIGNDDLNGDVGNDTLFGEDGDDQLYGGEGNDRLYGGDGSDTLQDALGEDYLDGGSGNDTLYANDGNTLKGGEGDDTYVYLANSGSVFINDNDVSNSIDQLDFSSHLKMEDVLFSRDSDTLLITIKSTNEVVTVLSYFSGSRYLNESESYGLEKFIFSDGVLSQNELKLKLLEATDSNDYILGYDSDDTLSGGNGHDRLYGFDGNDQLNGNEGNDDLVGGAGDDSLVGGKGEDYLSGGEGSDTYIYNLGDGKDTIMDYSHDVDINILKLGSGISALTMVMRKVGNDLALIFNDLDQVSISNYFSDEQYQLEIELFDGTTFTYDQIRQAVITPTEGDDVIEAFENAETIYLDSGDDKAYGYDGDDSLYGEEGNDQLWGGLGNDTLDGGIGNDTLYGQDGHDILNGGEGSNSIYGGAGNDTLETESGLLDGGDGDDVYLYRVGFGDIQIINDDYNINRNDTLKFGEGIKPEDVYLFISNAGEYGGGDLKIRVDGQGTITVINHFLNYISSSASEKGEIGNAINAIEFADGTYWSLDKINKLASIGDEGNNNLYALDDGSQIEGHAGNDVLQGGIGDDTLDGGIGDDTLDGGEGSDVYFYRLGDGNDTIRNDHSSQDSIDTLRFDSGINPQDVTVTSDYNYGLILSLSNGDSITIQDWFRESSDVSYLIDRVEFSDGTAWTSEQLTDLSQIPTDGNDAIRGFADEADDFSGGLGNDSLYGNKGNDLLNGDEGDDNLQGGDGNDVLVGGIGNDSLWGGNGVDTYRFGVDFGVDTIWETTNAEQNTIDLVDGLAPDQVNYKRYNDNLVLTISGDYSNAVIFKNFFTDGFSSSHFIYSDGSAFDSDSTQGVYLVADQNELAGMPGEFDPTNDELGHAGLIYNPGFVGFKLTGTQYNDYLIGQHLDDTLIGKGGDDVIFGGAGNDTITAYGTSALFGEAGDDVISLSSGEAHGGDGNDTIDVWWSNSTVSGGKGDDEISLHLPDEGEATRVIYNLGDGKDVIEVFGGQSTIVFGDGISLSDISPFYDELQNQLVLFLDMNNSIAFKYLTEANQFINDRPVLSDGKEVSLEFSDGSKFTIDEMYNVFYGTYGKTDAFDSEAGDFDHYVTGQDALDDQFDFGFENSDSYYVQALGGDDTVFGAQGNDRLEGGAGDDDLIGDAGDDALFGGEGNDEFEGGAGDDILSGGSGSNTYYYVGPSSEDPDFGSFGHDEIIVDGNDTIAFYDQDLAGLSFSRNQGNDLIISVTGDATSQITVKDWFLGASHQLTIENFNDDGPVGQLTATDINAQIDDIEPRLPPVLNGAVNDQSIQQGQNLNLAISASLFTDTGAIQYSATLADGSELPAWLSFDATNLTFSGTPENADVGDVSVTIIATDTHGLTNSTDFSIAVVNVNDAPVLENAISDQIVFNNKKLNVDLSSVFMEIDQGDSFTLNVTLADGSPLPSWIVFDSNTQTLVATHSSENLGTISILVTATDQFNAQTSTQFNLEVSDAEEFESVITGTANGEQLLGTSSQDLMQGLAGNDQLYGFGGNDQLEGGAGDDRLQGGNGSNTGSGDDVLIGGEGNDILVGEDGNDQLDGGNGDDHYYYYAGTGQDTLTDSGDGQDVLFFNDASLDRLSFHQQGNDLIVLIDGDLTQQVLVKDHFLGGNYEIYVQPDGGYTQTPAQIASMLSALPTDNGGGDNGGGDNGGGDNGGGDNGTVTDLNGDNSLTGTANTDIIAAGEGNDTLSGLAGNDRLIGGKGNDVYLLGSNSGKDIIADTEGSNIIRFVDGINFNDVASGIVKYGDDLILRIGSGGDEVQVENFFTVANTVETIEFETGGSISADQIFGLYGLSAPTTAVASGDIAAGDSGDNSVTSGSGNDIVLGLDGNDTLFGLEGDDTLLGGNGDDTYVIGANSGTDLIIDTDGTNRIRFVDGISFNDVASGLTGSGDDLILNIASTGNQVRINNFFSLANTISSLEFESGGEITAAQLYGAFGRAAPTATQITETGFGLDTNAQSEALMSAMASFDVAEETGDSNTLDPNRNQNTLMNEVA